MPITAPSVMEEYPVVTISRETILDLVQDLDEAQLTDDVMRDIAKELTAIYGERAESESHGEWIRMATRSVLSNPSEPLESLVGTISSWEYKSTPYDYHVLTLCWKVDKEFNNSREDIPMIQIATIKGQSAESFGQVQEAESEEIAKVFLLLKDGGLTTRLYFTGGLQYDERWGNDEDVEEDIRNEFDEAWILDSLCTNGLTSYIIDTLRSRLEDESY